MHGDNFEALFFASVALASPPASTVDLEHLEMLPPPGSSTLHCVFVNQLVYASARVMVGEVLQKHGRPEDSVLWAQTELSVRVDFLFCFETEVI